MENENLIKAHHASVLLLENLKEIYAHSKNEALIILATDMIDKVADIEAKLNNLCESWKV